MTGGNNRRFAGLRNRSTTSCWKAGYAVCRRSRKPHYYSREDHDLVWRRWVNLNAQKYHQALEQRTSNRWYLQAPHWCSVIDWRWQQEQELAQPALKTRQDVATFLAHFQRLVQHMQHTADNWADLIIPLNDAHCATIP